MKIIVALVVVSVVVVLITFLVFFPAQQKEIVVENIRTTEPKETEIINLVSPGDEIVNIEEDIRMFDKELESASEKLFNDLDAELNQL